MLTIIYNSYIINNITIEKLLSRVVEGLAL